MPSLHSITSGGTTIHPLGVNQYQARRPARTIVHDVLGRAEADITTRPAGLRVGTLRLSFDSSSAAHAASDLHASGATVTLASPVVGVGMSYVHAGGDITVSYNDAGEWSITVAFQEVSP